MSINFKIHCSIYHIASTSILEIIKLTIFNNYNPHDEEIMHLAMNTGGMYNIIMFKVI